MISLLLVSLLSLTGCFEAKDDDGPYIAAPTLSLTSTDFKPGLSMPAELTCEGANRSPQLSWSGAPRGTEAFVLIVDDPDAPDPMAPKMTWTHWVVTDIPGDAHSLPAGLTEPPAGAHFGLNSWDKMEYSGPCPPIGRHRYVHKLFALNRKVGDLSGMSPEEVATRIAPAVLGRTELVGTYEKTGVKK